MLLRESSAFHHLLSLSVSQKKILQLHDNIVFRSIPFSIVLRVVLSIDNNYINTFNMLHLYCILKNCIPSLIVPIFFSLCLSFFSFDFYHLPSNTLLWRCILYILNESIYTPPPPLSSSSSSSLYTWKVKKKIFFNEKKNENNTV